MAESFPNGQKTLWEKDKLLVTSNLSFSHSVFKRPALQTRKNQGLFGKGLKDKNHHLSYFVVLKHFQFKIFSFGKELTLYPHHSNS